jgi:asparagine synthase (glutamine-hydrolysing)
MCGIAGYWGVGTREVLQHMGDSLTHRGPDDGGILEVGKVGLAQRRLSIVDLSPAGHQPMSNREGTTALVFNGEIYNHTELKDAFLREYTFVGTSDTEVLLYLYEKFDIGFLKMVQGMFAVALYDRKKEILLLARDHMGKKPLYFTEESGTLIFGSELKALRKHPLCPHEIDHNAIAHYLVHEYVPRAETIYRGVRKLLPGTYLQYDGRQISEHSFSDVHAALGSYTGNEHDAKTVLHTHLTTAVQKRMVADVPVGVFLSGGLDSSTVAYFAQQASEQQVKTFSIGFKDASFDESVYAREVAKVLGTSHYERMVDHSDLLKVLEKLPEVLDEPMADSSIIPTLLLSEFTSSEVKVALGGDGADELLWGYETFFAHRMGMMYEKVPSVLRRATRAGVHLLPVSHQYMSLDFKAKKFLSGFDTTRARRNAYWLSAFTPEELPFILNGDIDVNHIFASTDAFYTDAAHFWDSLQMEYVQGYLAEDILVKVDRASMAHGLEVRAPFLDVNLVNFALSLPPDYKYRGRTGKYLLKELMREYLPEHIVMRSKKGFNIPIGTWIRHELKDLFMATLLDGELVKSGLFKRDGLAILLQSHLSGKQDQRKKLWTLFTLALWMKKWHD